jgi:carboxypeptidase Taq
MPKWRHRIEEGNFIDIKKWLAQNVHQHGNLYDPAVLIKKTTGEKINVKPYLEYLNTKCSWIYGY